MSALSAGRRATGRQKGTISLWGSAFFYAQCYNYIYKHWSKYKMKAIDSSQIMRDVNSFRESGQHDASIKLGSMAIEQYPKYAPFLFSTACTFMDMGCHGIAIVLLEKALKVEGNNWRVMANLANCYRRTYRVKESANLSKKALRQLKKDNPDWLSRCRLKEGEALRKDLGRIYTNIAACYVNEGSARTGEKYGRHAVEFDNTPLARWNLSLLLLEQGKWDEGFRLYRDGKSDSKRTPRNYHARLRNGQGPDSKTPVLDRMERLKDGDTVVVHGEQGIGDEIMFGTCLNEFLRDCKVLGIHVILECQDKLGELFRTAFPTLEIHATTSQHAGEVEWAKEKTIDWVLPIGDLPSIYRHYDVDFDQANERGDTAYLKANPDDAEHIRGLIQSGHACLRRQACRQVGENKPVIGITWTGGLIKTAATYRSLPLSALQPILELPAKFVSLQYDNPLQEMDKYREDYGEFAADIKHYELLSGLSSDSYQRMAELVMACDFIVTVCQSVAHLAGALGKPAIVLVPHKCAWRYCPDDKPYQVWYQNNRIIRQKKGESWAVGIREARDLAQRYICPPEAGSEGYDD